MNLPVLQTRNYRGPSFERLLESRPQTLNVEERTVTAVIATETPVSRFYGTEVLRCGPDNVDLSRMIGGPVLDSHNRQGVASIVGRIDDVRFEGRSLVATLTFSESAEGRAAMSKVQEGMIRNVSIGYAIVDYDEKRSSDGAIEVVAKKWMPHEVSIVSVPADPNTRIRAGGRSPQDSPPPSRIASREFADLRRSAVGQGLSEREIEDAFDGVSTIDEARSRVFDAMAARAASVRTSPRRGNDRSTGEDEATRNHFVSAIAMRLGGSGEAADNPFAGQSMPSMMRSFLEHNGASTRSMSDREVVDRALFGETSIWGGESRSMHTVSDFPVLFEEGANRVLLERFGAERSPLKLFSRQRNVSDFRRNKLVRPGEAPRLERLTEDGEIRHGTMQIDDKGAFQIEEYARIFALSRKAMMNDDLDVFTEVLLGFAEASATTEGDEFWNILSANAMGGQTLGDGKALFHADHGNLAGTGAAPSVDTLSDARKAMRLQTNVNGTGRAGVAPAVILVGPALETTAEQLVANLTPAQVAEVNPFGGKLRVEVESRYEGVGWWVLADPKSRPAFIHGYLNGAEGPQIATRDGWNRRGLEVRATLDFGCGAYDHRAIYFNPGE